MAVILHRRGSDDEWSAANTTLEAGEIGYVTSGANAGRIKVGDGTTQWNSLPFYPNGTASNETDLTFIESISSPDFIQFDTTPENIPTAPGNLWWNSDFETLNIQIDDAVTLQVGQEHVIRVKNNSGSVAIPERTPVMFAGATGDTVKVSPADGSNVFTIPSDYFVGITTEEIPADGFGFVTQFGFINQVNTAAWTIGTLLYVDPATPGGLTATRPAAPAWQTPVAAVTRQQTNSGRILVRAIPGILVNHLEGISIASPQDDDLLSYETSSGLWVNKTGDGANLVTKTGDQTIAGIKTFSNNVIVGGDLTVNGTTTSINATDLIVKDKNIVLANVDTPTDTTADGGGITIKGATDKTFIWSNTSDSFEINNGLIVTGELVATTIDGGTA
jgi:hypothetical protein